MWIVMLTNDTLIGVYEVIGARAFGPFDTEDAATDYATQIKVRGEDAYVSVHEVYAPASDSQ